MGRIFLVLLGVLASCNAVRVNYDYEKETDFTSYTTYKYYADMETGLSDLDTKRLLRVLDDALQSKGLRFSSEPDFFINVQSTTFQTPKKNTVGVGLGGTGHSVGGGVSVGIPVGRPDVFREIRFDFVDSQKDMLYWQAISASSFRENVSPEVREENLRQVVEKVLSKYPPK